MHTQSSINSQRATPALMQHYQHQQQEQATRSWEQAWAGPDENQRITIGKCYGEHLLHGKGHPEEDAHLGDATTSLPSWLLGKLSPFSFCPLTCPLSFFP